MTDTESPADSSMLIVHSGGAAYAVESGRGVVTIGRDPNADVQIDDPRIAGTHLRVEFVDGRWRVADGSVRGTFVNGLRMASAVVTDGMTVHLGDPKAGKTLTFEVVGSSQPGQQRQSGADESDEHTGTWETSEHDPGVVRAGAAAAARRRELDISQRSLAAEGIINAGALIAFEKGRSWPRERTQAKLEEVLRWPSGTIARIRREGPVPSEVVTEVLSIDDQVPLIAQAVVAAVNGCSLAAAALPPLDDPEFTGRAAPILADLRRLETVAAHAARISKVVTPPLIRALSTVRRQYEDLMLLCATAPGATLGQRLYAARRGANLSILETAQAAGVEEETILHAEAEEAVPATAAGAIESLISQI